MERLSKRVMQASIQQSCQFVAFEGQTEVDRFPLCLVDHSWLGPGCHIPHDETLRIAVLLKYFSYMSEFGFKGVRGADHICPVSQCSDQVALLA